MHKMINLRASPSSRVNRFASTFAVALLACAVLVGCGNDSAGSTPEPEQATSSVIQFGGESYVVALEGSRAYLGSGPRVVAIDVTDPEAPQVVGQSPILAGVVEGLVSDPDGESLWVALGEGGLAALDADAGEGLPVRLAIESDQPIHDVAHDGEHVYGAAGPRALRVWDRDGQEVGRFNLGPPAGDGLSRLMPYEDPRSALAWTGQFLLHVHPEYGLRVVDVSSPSQPAQIGDLRIQTEDAHDVTVEGELAYVTGRPLRIVDISDPTRPRQVSPEPGANDSSRPWEESEQFALESIAVENGIAVSPARRVDATNPERLESVGLADEDAHVRPVLRDGIAYFPMGDTQGGLRIFDVREAAGPRLLSELALVGSVRSVQESDGHAVVGAYPWASQSRVLIRDGGGVQLEPLPPDGTRHATSVTLETATHRYTFGEQNLLVEELGAATESAPTEVEVKGAASDMARTGDLLLLADSGWEMDITRRGPKYLEVVSLVDPGKPEVVGTVEFAFPLSAVAAIGDTAFVSVLGSKHLGMFGEPQPGTIVAVDVSSPSNPQVIGNVEPSAFTLDLAASDDSVLAATQVGIDVLTLDASGGLSRTSHIKLPGNAWELALTEDRAWVAAETGGVFGLPLPLGDQALDETTVGLPPVVAASTPQPTATTVAPSLPQGEAPLSMVGRIGGPVNAVTSDGTHVFIAQGQAVVGLDGGAQGSLHFRGRTPLLGAKVVDVAAGSGWVYAAMGTDGLAAIEAPSGGQRLEPNWHDDTVEADLVAASGRHLVTASDAGQLAAFSLDDPGNPQPLATLDLTAIDPDVRIQDLAVHGATIGVAAGQHGFVLLEAGRDGIERVASVTEGLIATAAALSDGRAYVVDGGRTLQVIDITNPASPRIGARLELDPGTTRMEVHGDTLVLLNSETATTVVTVDVSDPASPERLHGLSTDSGYGRLDLTVVGDQVVQIDTEAAGVYLTPLSRTEDDVPPQFGADPHTVSLLHDFVFESLSGDEFAAVTGSGVTHIVDLTDPEIPRQSAAVDLGYDHQALSGHYLLQGHRHSVGRLTLYDLRGRNGFERIAEVGPGQSSTVPGYPHPWPGAATDSAGTVGPPSTSGTESGSDGPTGPFEFHRVRYETPTHSDETETREIVTVTDGAGDVMAVFDVAYGEYAASSTAAAIDRAAGLLVTHGPEPMVFDIDTVPATQVGQIALTADDGSPLADGSVVLDGSLTWHISADGVRAIDLSDPGAPAVGATFKAGMLTYVGGGHRATVSGDRLYIMERVEDRSDDAYIAEYDVSDPANPTRTGVQPMGSSVDGLHAMGDYVYTTGSGGVSVYRRR